MAHHGQHGVERTVYETIQPRCCLWCTPTWLWDNIGPDGYDSGEFHTVVVRGWMSEMGVRRHYMNAYENSRIVIQHLPQTRSTQKRHGLSHAAYSQ